MPERVLQFEEYDFQSINQIFVSIKGEETMESSTDPRIILLLTLCGGLCAFSTLGLSIFAIISAYNRARRAPMAMITTALVKRLDQPKQIVYAAPVPESVALKKWQTIQIWTAIVSVVALIAGLVFFGLGDIAVAILAIAAQMLIELIKFVIRTTQSKG